MTLIPTIPPHGSIDWRESCRRRIPASGDLSQKWSGLPSL